MVSICVTLISLLSLLCIILARRANRYHDESTSYLQALNKLEFTNAHLQSRIDGYKHQLASYIEHEKKYFSQKPAIQQNTTQFSTQQETLNKQISTLQSKLQTLHSNEEALNSSIDLLQLREKELGVSVDLLQSRKDELIVSINSLDKKQQELTRFISAKRNDRQIGLDFERYIGFLYEKDGYEVLYTGAEFGKEDHGIDLIATHDDTCLLIQCKRWKAISLIRENTISQLFGSVALYQKNHADLSVTGVLYATCPLSSEAISDAQQLGIEIHESFHFEGPGSYPLIKCHKNQHGEKIYHLPTEHQYDTISINFSSGEFYAKTVGEAISAGFRHE